MNERLELPTDERLELADAPGCESVADNLALAGVLWPAAGVEEPTREARSSKGVVEVWLSGACRVTVDGLQSRVVGNGYVVGAEANELAPSAVLLVNPFVAVAA